MKRRRTRDTGQGNLFGFARLHRPAQKVTQPDAGQRKAAVTPLPTVRAAQLAEAQVSEPAWMIEGLWGAEAVGIIGGEAKCGKTWLALDLAIAVATGAPCLRHFPTRRTGPVLVYAAEDSSIILRQRLQGIAAAAGVDFATLNIHVICVPALRLDRPADQEALRATVAALRPALLTLDPFVRLHAADENVAGEVAPMLAYLRALQREFHTGVVLAHHARKGAAHERGGQALRGSSDLHAFGDSNLYLRRHAKGLFLDIEHRAAPGHDKLPVELVANPPALALRLVEPQEAPPPAGPSCEARIEEVLAAAGRPLTQKALRAAVRMRSMDVNQALAALVAAGRITKSAAGYGLASSP